MDIMVQIELGFQIIICSYVGKQIGAGNLQKARHYHNKVYQVGFVFGLVAFLFQITFKEQLLMIFTNNEEVL